MKKYFLLTLIPLFCGCQPQVISSHRIKSYEVGIKKTAAIGEAFLVDQTGTVRKVKRWVGLLYSPDGWKVSNEYSKDYVKKELIYSGKSGATINVAYREYRANMAAPAFFQNLSYDLSESDVIRFQRFLIKIFDADNQTITFSIASDNES